MGMLILVINCGSSSVKAEVIDHESGARRVVMRAQRLGSDEATVVLDDGEERPAPSGHEALLAEVLPARIVTVPDSAVKSLPLVAEPPTV